MSEQNPEFSRVINVTRIPPNGLEQNLEAKPSECEALAKRFGLVALSKLQAHLTLVPGAQKTLAATGAIQADVTQCCVVSLDPIVNHLDIKVDIAFIPELDEEDPGVLDDDELEDEFEYFKGENIDLGEVVAQQLGINLDPYPRKPDATLAVSEVGPKADAQRPFAKLGAALKSKKNKGKR